MFWRLSHRYDKGSVALADRHYSRQKVGSDQFVAPGSPIVLIGENKSALWVTLKQKFQKHQWPGAWVCTHFRNEGEHLSSDLIIEAVAITRAYWGVNPKGLITFIDPEK